MADKVTIMVLKVDLHCSSCYKKIKKVLCKFPEIRNQVYDEKANTVTITVVCCNPEKIRDKLCCKGGKTIKSIEIKPPPKPKEKPKTPPPEKPECKPKDVPPPPAPPPPPPPAPPPPPPPPPVPVPVGVCCGQCYQGHYGGPCYQGYRRPVPCYDGYGYGYGYGYDYCNKKI